ncbi:MAG TPA: hypothetical protein VN969_34160 [Streptosporangiaceae bacterium]|nr:hypothetical protein [Streptosporangiaceae bacterium]
MILADTAAAVRLLSGPEQERRQRERLAAFAQQDQAGLAVAVVMRT